MGPCTHEPDVRSGCPAGQFGGQAADGPTHAAPCPSPTRELPPARPNAVHEDHVALLAEPPHRAAHGGLGRGDRGGELGDGEGPGGEGGGHAAGDARAGEEVGRLRELGVRDRHRTAGREAEAERERGRPAPAVVLPVIGGDEELVGSGAAQCGIRSSIRSPIRSGADSERIRSGFAGGGRRAPRPARPHHGSPIDARPPTGPRWHSGCPHHPA
jgi:hypothetical protein